MDWRERLLDYLHLQLPSADSLRITRVSGMPAGASNDTVGFDLAVGCGGEASTIPLVLRPQRRDGILAPYDVGRQFRVMRALARTDVPVPATMWYEPSGDVLGTPFFVMQRVAGETLPLFWYGGRSPRLEAIARTLAEVHAVDWRAAGLVFLLPVDGALPSPLDCDLAQWRAKAAISGLDRQPNLVALGGFLAANEPRDARHGLLHGDPNPGNYLLQGDRVAAVVDWEVAAIGDPRSDLGFYAALLTVFGGMGADGGRTILSDTYAAVTGQTLVDLNYYEAVGLYKMAVVMAGWAGRGVSGYYGMDAIARRLTSLFGPRWAG